MTAADLGRRGGAALNDAQLKQLVVGKTLVVRNTVTGQRFDILYGEDGRRLVTSIDGKTPPLGEIGNPLHGDVLGAAAPYVIQDRRLRTTISGSEFEVTIYKAGGKYYGARSNEFGFANYEIEEVKE